MPLPACSGTEIAVAARSALWLELLSLVRLQAVGGDEAALLQQHVHSHILDSKIIELVLDVLLSNVRPVSITVRERTVACT